MIFTPIIYLFGLILLLLSTVLTWISNTIIPSEINTAFIWLFDKVNIFNGIFPIETLLSAGLFVITVWISKYTIKFGLWLISFIPWVKYQELPHMSETTTVGYRYDQQGNKITTSRSVSTTKKKGYFKR